MTSFALPPENLLGSEEGLGFTQLMNELPRERLIVAVHAQAMMERALTLTVDYVKKREAFGKKLIDFQNTQFVLAECKSEATIARVFHDHCIERYLNGELDTVTASMAKYWPTDLQGQDHRPMPAALWRLRLYGRISDLAHVSRFPRHAHLCGHERDHEAGDCAQLVTVIRAARLSFGDMHSAPFALHPSPHVSSRPLPGLPNGS